MDKVYVVGYSDGYDYNGTLIITTDRDKAWDVFWSESNLTPDDDDYRYHVHYKFESWEDGKHVKTEYRKPDGTTWVYRTR